MASTQGSRIISSILGLLLFCAPAVLSSTLPSDISMNRDAGRGGMLFITVRLDDGEKLPFILDTGSAITILDQSLEPKLGKRVRSDQLWTFGASSSVNVYFAPRLYLGKTQLMKIGPFVFTHDCRPLAAAVGHPVMGVLGIDVLHNYCLQLDFAADKIRFFDDARANKKHWGTPLSLVPISDGCCSITNNLTGVPGVGSLIDTGCNYDGWLVPQLYQQWTDPAAPPIPGQSHSPTGILAGETYPILDLHDIDPKLLLTGDQHLQLNGIGLHLLARHLVTFDFPEETLYLKRTSLYALDSKEVAANLSAESSAAVKILKKLYQEGILPGWSNSDQIAGNRLAFHLDGNTITLEMYKQGDASIYHYLLTRPVKGVPWKLQKAWRTDSYGSIIQQYSVP